MRSQSDTAALWEEALDDYKKVTDVDMRVRLTSQRSISSILMDQQRQLENFKVFRHDKGKLDKFRTMISSNADIIQGVAKSVADAASAAFPPSSAILTAFTFVMTASKHVSDDYDMIEGFFSIMQSFLQRLSLLENKIPPQRAFQIFLINVFSSLLKISGIARAYCAKGRLSKWAKALVDGKDPDLNAAYGNLNKNLQELESAIIIQTLRTTIEISEEARSTNKNVKVLQGQLDHNTAMTMQTLETSEQTLLVTMRTDAGMQELLLSSHDNTTANNELLSISGSILKKIDKMQSKDKITKQSSMKSGASRPVNFERLKMDLQNAAEGGIAERLMDMKLSYVDHLFDWIENEPAFESIVNEEESFLWVRAGPGMGKSTLSFRMMNYLEEKYSCDPTTCVMWFPFDEEHSEMRSVTNMIRCCSIRAAQKDADYCKETLKALFDIGIGEDGDVAWTQLIELRYTKTLERRLILILDSIDEIAENDFPELVKFLGRIRSLGSKVQVIFLCGPDKEKELSVLAAKCIDLDRNKIVRDMRRFAWSKTKTLSRLRKLRVTVRKTIIRKVMRKADSFLYIDHTMRRLNALGREGLILKDLEDLSDNTVAIYHTLLAECQKNRTSEDRELLRNLLAWLAYTKSEFTVAEANLLIEIINKDNSISMEEELDGRLSRLLRISGDRAETEQDDSSENDDKAENLSDENLETEASAEDASNFLSFQERSLKAYFRDAIQDHSDGLRCTAIEAQAIIFRTCSSILTMPKKNQKAAGRNLVNYASRWGLSHLSEIKPEEEDKVSDDLAKVVIESIYNIFTNKNDSLKPMEVRVNEKFTILSGAGITQEQTLAMLSAWAKRALRLPPNQLPYGILDWFRPLAQEPLRVFIGLSRTHITNWFSSTRTRDAYSAFFSAHSALQEGRNLPELKQNPSLEKYFEDFMKGDEQITERSFEVVAACFWDIVKTSSSYKGIGMAMTSQSFYEPAVKQLNIGLADTTIDKFERFQLLSNKGDALLEIGQRGSDKEKKKEYLEESLSTLNEANELYRSMKEAGQIDDELKATASFNFKRTTLAAATLGKSDLVLSSVTEDQSISGGLDVYLLGEVITALKNAGQLSTIIDLLKLSTKADIAWFLTVDDNESAQEAAMSLNQGQYLLDLYNSTERFVEIWPFGPDNFRTQLQSNAAAFARQALGNLVVAKSLLREMINHPKTASWWIFEGCNRLAEILLEEFRLSKDPLVKNNALDETMKLFDKLAEVAPDSYNAAESHITVTVALMLRRLGPALDLSDRLHAAFRNCVEELQDDTGTNDATALRRLSRVLSCVPGFERAASISLTVSVYVVDEAIHYKDLKLSGISQEDEAQALSVSDNRSVNDVPAQEDLKIEHDVLIAMGSDDALVNGKIDHGKAEEGVMDITSNGVVTMKDSDPPVVVDEIDEGLLEEIGCYCNTCRKDIQDWSHGGVYYCIYCIDNDICEECFSKKTAREKGELEPDWRVICPPGHRHIKAPVEGWRGVKDGKMRIGKEEMLFKTWLTQLEVQWKKYWEGFWTTETL